jgi:UDP-glucose 4-epimerase
MLCTEAGRPDIEPVFAPPRTVNPVTRRLASVTAAREALGFTATTTLADGLRRLVDWHASVTAPQTVVAAG